MQMSLLSGFAINGVKQTREGKIKNGKINEELIGIQMIWWF